MARNTIVAWERRHKHFNWTLRLRQIIKRQKRTMKWETAEKSNLLEIFEFDGCQMERTIKLGQKQQQQHQQRHKKWITNKTDSIPFNFMWLFYDLSSCISRNALTSHWPPLSDFQAISFFSPLVRTYKLGRILSINSFSDKSTQYTQCTKQRREREKKTACTRKRTETIKGLLSKVD